jgi:membrane associated rhomboid family serine protease
VRAEREKILNVPAMTKAIIAVLTGVQFVVAYGPEQLSAWLFETFAFIPARIMLEGGASAYATMLTYAFLHGDWTHLIVNAVSLAAFGSPVERRFGPAPFLAFLGASAFAGALLFLVFHPYDVAPVVGASAAISGTMGAIARFAFAPGARLAEEQRGPTSYEDRSGSLSLSQLRSNSRAIFFLVVWFGINFLLGAFPQAAGVSSVIAWEAHIGGFLFGLLSFSLFDRAVRHAP